MSSPAFDSSRPARAAVLPSAREHERAAHTDTHADHLVILDSTVAISLHEPLHRCDLDLTLAEPELARSARMLGRPLFVYEPTIELPGRALQLVSAPVYAIRPDGSSSFDERIAYRAVDLTLRRRGVRPHRHPPDRLAAWVFGQHHVWVDRHGTEHEIESMPRAHQRAVIGFCRSQAKRIRLIVASADMFESLQLSILDGEPERGLALAQQVRSAWDTDAKTWLEQTPLIRALRRQLDAGGGLELAHDHMPTGSDDG